ncbi:MAG: hypothetical protein HC895_13070 [Leptolyngbyaceae cyanobacterium SM1_3_5]|nr:hypothetical protein [Leptolyngbyaceae cyanobacterium SM1_3_5]
MTNCPCCEYLMLKAVHHHQTVWFCRHCWQEMPNLTIQDVHSLLNPRSLEQTLQQSAQTLPASFLEFEGSRMAGLT